MGVPAFYRWLRQSYPRCVTNFREIPASFKDDLWAANPNGVEFDNLYLDFNQIIHVASHPSDRPAPPTRSLMLRAILNHLDRLVLAVRPRKLLVIALDGVAPRAKMNQQRARRFVSAQERSAEGAAQAAMALTWGAQAPDEHFDHNAITPGTEFMAEVGSVLRRHVANLVATSPAFARLNVLVSDAAVPGEGEHKIVSIIRQQRLMAGYDPDTTHLVYGLDADLVMLGLATHERRFYLLRDWVPIGRERHVQVCEICGNEGHSASACTVLHAARTAQEDSQRAAEAAGVAARLAAPADVPLQLLSLPVLREYLLHMLRPEALGRIPAGGPDDVRVSLAAAEEAEAKAVCADDGRESMAGSQPPSDTWWDSERLIDDFVFLTFLVGNDFLPALPTMSIATGGLDAALDVYREQRRGLGGYLLDAGQISQGPLARFLLLLARSEDDFVQRKVDRAKINAKRRRVKLQVGTNEAGTAELASEAEAQQEDSSDGGEHLEGVDPDANRCHRPPSVAGGPADSAVPTGTTRAWRAEEDRLRFGRRAREPSFAAEVSAAYMQALAWCSAYYYQGCADWRFFYPYHYAPFVSDIAAHAPTWEPGPWGAEAPLPPLTQLCCVLPPLSASLLPASYGALLTDDESPHRHLFPREVKLDHRGKKHAYQAVVLLPFLPLAEVCDAIEHLPLEEEEATRNAHREPLLFTSPAAPLPTAATVRTDRDAVRGVGWSEVGWGAGYLAGEYRALDAAVSSSRSLTGGAPVWMARYRPVDPPSPHRCEMLTGGTALEPSLTMLDLVAAGGSRIGPQQAESASSKAMTGKSIARKQTAPSSAKRKRRSGGGSGGGGGGGGVAGVSPGAASKAAAAPGSASTSATASSTGGDGGVQLFGFTIL
jgi:5'-3' exoribonuclease 2